jgi:hypothetical protein
VKRKSPTTFDTFCREAVDFLAGASTPYLIIGGLAVAVIGEPRMTGDVDVIGYLSMEQASVLIDAAVAAGFEVAPDERERLHATGTLRFTKGRFQLDIILASLPFEDDARARARKRHHRRAPVLSRAACRRARTLRSARIKKLRWSSIARRGWGEWTG